MSGGSYNYIYVKIKDFADELRINDCPRRMAFKNLLNKVAKAAHDIEWVDSCDYGEGDDHKSIDACFTYPEREQTIQALTKIEDIFNALKQINEGE